MTAAIRPVFLNARLLWLEFQRATLNPLAPQLPQIMAEIAELESERRNAA